MACRKRFSRAAFTLIELLVVITIIVVLLSLLTPALDKAIYQAELAMCSSHLRTIGGGAVTYAMEHRRRFFYRQAVDDMDAGYYRPRDLNLPFNTGQLNNPDGYDDRPMMREYLSISAFQCPLAGEVLLDEPRTSRNYVSGAYANWIGWRYDIAGQQAEEKPKPSRGLFRLGDRLGYDGETYSVMAGDIVETGWGDTTASHPDDWGLLAMRTQQANPDAVGGEARQNAGETSTFSDWYWAGPGVNDVGAYDLNYLYNDVSVRRFPNQRRGGPLFIWVPPHKDVKYTFVGTLMIPRN